MQVQQQDRFCLNIIKEFKCEGGQQLHLSIANIEKGAPKGIKAPTCTYKQRNKSKLIVTIEAHASPDQTIQPSISTHNSKVG